MKLLFFILRIIHMDNCDRGTKTILDIPDDVLRFMIDKFLSNELQILLVCRRFYYIFSNNSENLKKRDILYLKYCSSFVDRLLLKNGQYVCKQCGEVHKCKPGIYDKNKKYKEKKCYNLTEYERSCQICGKCNSFVQSNGIQVCRSCRDRFTTDRHSCKICVYDRSDYSFYNFKRSVVYVWNVLEKKRECKNKKVYCRHCQKTYAHTEVPENCPYFEFYDLTEGEEAEEMNNFRKKRSYFRIK